MQIKKLHDNYTIVVVANIEAPFYIQASWMRDRNIINNDEWFKIKDPIVVPDTSRFNIGESITFYCDKNRFQIGTNDITKISRVQSIAEGIVSALDISDDSFKAVGINNEFIFTFNTEEDSVHFGDFFVPLNKWNTLFETPRVLEFSITEGAPVLNCNSKKTIKVSCVGVQENSKIAVLNANSNDHHKIETRQDGLNVIKTALTTFMDFNKNFTAFINELQ